MISITDITNVLKEKNPDAIDLVLKSYKLAEFAHEGVYRESGEPYITHPLNVALNLLRMEVYDRDAICAALLHDTVEDNEDISLEDLSLSYIEPDVYKRIEERRNNLAIYKERSK